MIAMPTVSSGPKRIANTGAISMPEPTPTKPRMRLAISATTAAIPKSALPMTSKSSMRSDPGHGSIVLAGEQRKAGGAAEKRQEHVPVGINDRRRCALQGERWRALNTSRVIS